jgi:two-component system nitrate/nitrite response regulator NarL
MIPHSYTYFSTPHTEYMTEEPIKIIIADDHPLVRDGIKTVLHRIPDFQVVAEAEDGLQLLELIKQYSPQVALIDISMPHLNGLDALKELSRLHPALKLIILTMHEEPEYILKSLSSGAQAYLLKNVSPEELQKAIRTVVNGGKYFNQMVSGIIMENLAKPELDEEALTPRELEVLRLVGRGMSNHQIASELFISIRTVEKHRVNVLRKMQAVNTADLVRKAVEKGLIE